jgi:hypothetical protein
MKVAFKWIVGTWIISIMIYVVAMFILCKVHYKSLPLFYSIMGEYAAPNGGFTYQASLDWETSQKYDVVVLGASRAQRSYNTQFFDSLGLHLFNMGTPSQSLKNSRILIENHIKSGQVKEVWLDVVPGLFVDGAIESSSDLIQNWVNASTAMQVAVESRDLRSLNLWMKRIFCENSIANNGRGEYIRSGFVSVNEKLSDALINKWHQHDYGKEQRGYVSFGEESWQELERIIAYCIKEQIQLRVIASPVSVFNNHYDQLAMNQRLEQILTQHHVPFYDYSKRNEWNNPDYFYDEKHMNINGVRKFNLDLWNTLSSN